MTDQSTPTLFADRYEIVNLLGTAVEALDRQPWLKCWACSAANEPGELFCTSCGAALDGRRYPGQLISGALEGLALVPGITDEKARAVLPQVWDQVRTGKRTLTLAAPSNRAALAPPLDERAALRVGADLARLLVALHAQGLALGAVTPADLEIAADGAPVLRTVPNLRRGKATAADLRALGELLEALTATPRTTRRLPEGEAEQPPEAGMAELLSALRTGEIDDAAQLTSRLDDMLAERSQPAPLWARVGAYTDKGMVREHNEDGMFALDLRSAHALNVRSWALYIVADGMGGHAAGEVASSLAIRGATEVVLREYLTPTVEADLPDEQEKLSKVVHAAIVQANTYVLREARARNNDMGTTITMALVAGNQAVVGNIGDSRTYLQRGGTLKRISKDHSLVQRLVDLGQIEPDDVYTHPQRNAVLRSLGDRQEIDIDLFPLRLRPGDTLLLCSDGQWEMTHDPQIEQILNDNADPQAAAQALVAAANVNGGEDNIASIVARFDAYAKEAK